MANEVETVGEELTLKQELFCQYYVKNDALYGNATLAYAEAYGYDLENADRDDMEYEMWDGSIMTGHELHDYNIRQKDSKDKLDYIQMVKESTYTRMYNVCSVSSSKLLRNPKINQRVKDLLNEMLNDSDVDAELAKMIRDKKNDNAKIQAIKEYNKLKMRIVDRVDATTMGKPLSIAFDKAFTSETEQK